VIPGTLVNQAAGGGERDSVTFGHPSGTLQVGAERYNMFTGCPQAKTATIVLRGGSEQVRGCAFAMLGLSEPGLICISG
jgi:2-methylaconitate cis-trans-isomerase PrpF